MNIHVLWNVWFLSLLYLHQVSNYGRTLVFNSSSDVKPFFNFRQELSLFDDLILKGNCIVIPYSLRREMKNLLHNGHIGIVKMKTLARDSVYWPGMSSELEELVQNCNACQEFQNLQKDEPLLFHDIPDTPWVKVATDLFTLDSNDYLLVVDDNSNYFDLSLIPDKQSSTVALHTKRIFARYGIPKLVISDNGPEFTGSAYKRFSHRWDFKHVTSSPHYPKSNGLVERTVQTVKKALKKAFRTHEDPYLALLSLKVAPGPYNAPSPASTVSTTNSLIVAICQFCCAKTVQI